MLSEDLLSCLEATLRHKFKKPMGGKQIILVGDFMQLPPVEEKSILYSSMLSEYKFNFIYARTILRQTDPKFINLLNDVRFNTLNEESMKNLITMRRILQDPIMLRCTNAEVDRINNARMSSIAGVEHTYDVITTKECSCSYSPLKKIFPSTLKVGCKVMLLTNMNVEIGLVNGAIGLLVGFSDTFTETFTEPYEHGYESNDTIPIVNFHGTNYGIGYIAKNHTIKVKSAKSDIPATKKICGSIIYVPLKLSWSITIHKAQGGTYSDLDIYISRPSPGLFYTALSRAKSMNSVNLAGFVPQWIQVDQDIIKQLLRLCSLRPAVSNISPATSNISPATSNISPPNLESPAIDIINNFSDLPAQISVIGKESKFNNPKVIGIILKLRSEGLTFAKIRAKLIEFGVTMAEKTISSYYKKYSGTSIALFFLLFCLLTYMDIVTVLSLILAFIILSIIGTLVYRKVYSRKVIEGLRFDFKKEEDMYSLVINHSAENGRAVAILNGEPKFSEELPVGEWNEFNRLAHTLMQSPPQCASQAQLAQLTIKMAGESDDKIIQLGDLTCLSAKDGAVIGGMFAKLTNTLSPEAVIDNE
jgi:hypothetical protein